MANKQNCPKRLPLLNVGISCRITGYKTKKREKKVEIMEKKIRKGGRRNRRRRRRRR